MKSQFKGHTIPEYNGGYLRGEDINGQPSFSKPSGHTLYFTTLHQEAQNLSLHKRRTDGSKDYYDGGWTRPPFIRRPAIRFQKMGWRRNANHHCSW